MQIDLSGKTAVVTGGANGIGNACARALAGAGATVWVFDLEEAKPEAAAAEFGGRGHVMDVTRASDVEAAFAAQTDALSTALLVRGSEMIESLRQSRAPVRGLVVERADSGPGWRTTTLGLAPEERVQEGSGGPASS
ncbi:MAG: SDR family NAD(P)-dependent oxidoreductase [Burkholderiales bacterium]|nr:SDR family NAD(P)-dependent oxidoreductase [Burkholderiales bacterium]